MAAVTAGAALCQSTPGEKAAQKPAKLRDVGTWIAFTQPIREPAAPGRALGRVDVKKTVQALLVTRLDTYCFFIWQGPNDLEDFKQLLIATQRAKINMWVCIAPPQVGANSLPHRGSYGTWTSEFVDLARRHPNLTAFFLFDLDVGRNSKLFHPVRVNGMRKAFNSVGMNMVIGLKDVTSTFTNIFGKGADAVVVNYTNQQTIGNLSGLLAGARALGAPHWKLIAGYYCSTTPWSPRPPTPDWLWYGMRRVLKKECDACVLTDLDFRTPAPHDRGPRGVSKLTLTAKNFLQAVKAGNPPPPPRYK
ncbi:MAG: hypothetical protein CMJ85_08045 [Planctomycetes bacterium]|jgi:hypothetical protein|nr:hypothetical protein [Planctomycetota bacterium]